MRRTNNTFARALLIWAAAVLSLALATGIFAKVFAVSPEEQIEVEPDVEIWDGPFAYTGEQICPTALLVTAYLDYDEVTLEDGTDYTFSCGENIAIGEKSGVINVSAVDDSLYTFDDFTINFPIWEYLQEISYENKTIVKTYGDDDFTNPLTETDVHGEIHYYSLDEDVAQVDPSTGEVTILMPGDTVIKAIAEAEDGYGEGIATYTLKVNKKPISIVSATVEDKVYDGTTTGMIDEIEVSEEDFHDYEAIVNFEDANVGVNKNATVTLRLSNDVARYYDVDPSGYATTGTIEAYEIDEFSDSDLSEYNYVYSGNENKPTVRILAPFETGTDRYLTEGTDFTVTYPEDTVNAGEKTILVSGINNFVGDFELEYTVEKYTLTANNVNLEYSIAGYDGTPKTPAVTVKIGDVVIDPNDYAVSHVNNVEIGEAEVYVVAKANTNIDGYAVKRFTISEKQVLDISGISNQTVTYTSAPVVLNGSLTVAPNAGGITADDLTVKWYDDEGENEIEHPTDAGSYIAVYSYEDEYYMGSLTVEFTIAKADSPMPAEMYAGLSAEVGYFLDEIEFDWSYGFSWIDGSALVSAGNNTYYATYTFEGDENNYTTIALDVPVYGLARIWVDVEVDTDGGDVEYPDEAYEGDQVEIKILPYNGWEIRSVMVNGMEITSSVSDNKLILTAGDTDIDVLVSFRRSYNVIEGDGMNYVVGAGKQASFRFDVDHELFVNGGKVYVDGMLIGEGYYTHTSGSTIITFTEEFMNFIGDGLHTVAVVFGDGGIARANFSVANSTNPAKAPNTGFMTGLKSAASVIGITTFAMAFIAGGVIYKKKFARSKVDFDKK